MSLAEERSLAMTIPFFGRYFQMQLPYLGVNLIDGDVNFVVEFLDRLTYGPGSTPRLAQNQAAWREKNTQKSQRQHLQATG
jgi:hypothetical protein